MVGCTNHRPKSCPAYENDECQSLSKEVCPWFDTEKKIQTEVRITSTSIGEEMALPDRMSLFRRIMQNNGISHMNLEVETTEVFLPRVLVVLGLFPSANQVRKNKPDYFRDVVPGETVKVGRLNIRIKTA